MAGRALRVPATRSLALVGAAIMVPAFAGFAVLGRIDDPGIATIEVKPGRFVREVEARGSLKAVKATPILVPPESGRQQKVAFLAKDGAFVKAGETVVAFDPYDAERQAADGQSDLDSAQAKIEKARAEGSKNHSALGIDRDVAREELDRAETFELSDESLYSRQQIIESRLDRELFQARANVAERKLVESGRLSAAERALGEIDASKAQLKVKVAEQGLRSLRLPAPHDGLLILERNWRGEMASVGDTLFPGQKVAEVPDLSRLEARVFVLEADGAGLKIGQTARFVVEGRPGEEYDASVSRVEPLAKTRDWQSPVKYFETTLTLARADAADLKPGQKVRAIVRLEEAQGVLAIPRGAVFEKDGKRVVYRKNGAGFGPVEVEASSQSISHLVVAKGLSAGDVIALRDPTAKRALSTPGTTSGGPGT
jgi:HlyD family secretion protein